MLRVLGEYEPVRMGMGRAAKGASKALFIRGVGVMVVMMSGFWLSLEAQVSFMWDVVRVRMVGPE